MEKLSIHHLGPIESAEIEFGDFTLLIGPQASGKSIFLQMVKLLVDKASIANVLKSYGYVWNNPDDFLELFFGEGMSQIWHGDTKIEIDGEDIEKNASLNTEIIKPGNDAIFYIPAQRVIALQNGWPKPFSDFGNDPYILKSFSEILRLFTNQGMEKVLFSSDDPRFGRDRLYESVYYDGELEMDLSGHRKRLVLNIGGNKIPFMGWSAGQKEFMPLWLGIYFFLYISSFEKSALRMVIVEEPEMGLHPLAIEHVIVRLLELMREGYKVVISTHSPMLLEFIWAMQFLKASNAPPGAVIALLRCENANGRVKDALEKALKEKVFKTYYFGRSEGKTRVKDISTLDAASDDPDIAEWGGLSTFASRASEIVAKHIPL